jgi:hypothetical protein
MIPPPMLKKRRITTNLQVHLPPHRKHNVKNHQWSQKKWGSTHKPHHNKVFAFPRRMKSCIPTWFFIASMTGLTI